MKILFTIPHFFEATGGAAADGRQHGSARDPLIRAQALSACVTSLHQLYACAPAVLVHDRKEVQPLTQVPPYQIEIVVCTAGDRHVLPMLPLPPQLYRHHRTSAPPLELGFECHAVLRDRLGAFDYYCYLEDDLILLDPWFFHKLAWFSQKGGDDKLLQPNRFEAALETTAKKMYVDGDLAPQVTADFQDISGAADLAADILGRRLFFRRTRNPHAGCFCLSARQMEHWVAQPFFLDRDKSFVSGLESAATLGIMRAFKVYKPGFENADFLEVQHFGNAYLREFYHQ
jgi:hypothetical protein